MLLNQRTRCCLMNILSSDNTHTVTVEDINTACNAAKIGKTAGSDGITMDAFCTWWSAS